MDKAHKDTFINKRGCEFGLNVLRVTETEEMNNTRKVVGEREAACNLALVK